ncbi:PhnA domain-containing protein [Marinobacterium rhizophilum]|uniref:PhnA domain-containing protein n=1 Tax=Marinobacterium rhizophilum TaxID=420402 RepID=A0ABY5HNY9_9GAMM|nr:alkylphosphonate utilization protein [Marinobacterium rhizophilum]UTW14020.1 PhnA domain-containing protein [Marinobacterium rhizophilum]
MTIEQHLLERSGGKCELCASDHNLKTIDVSQAPAGVENQAVLCETCYEQIDDPRDVHHWRCLSESMWSQVPAIQVLAWRQLKRLSVEPWAQDLLDMLYLEPVLEGWAQAAMADEDDDSEPTLDSNGTRLQEGDSVTLIKDLDVKGAGFTAKRGTPVRDIRLTSNPKHIEGKVNGVQIVLVAAYLKKA